MSFYYVAQNIRVPKSRTNIINFVKQTAISLYGLILLGFHLLLYYWHPNKKAGPFVKFGLIPYLTIKRFDDIRGNGQTHAHPARFGGEIRME